MVFRQKYNKFKQIKLIMSKDLLKKLSKVYLVFVVYLNTLTKNIVY